MESYSTYVFIAVIMSGVGYMASHTRNFNIWKMGLIAFIAAPIVMNLEDSETAIWVAVISFFAGFMLPHAHILDGFFRAGSEAINGIRYRDDRRNIESQKEELKRKEEELRRREDELERLRREYEEAMNRARGSRHSNSDNRSKQESGSGRKQDKQQNYDQKDSREGAGAGAGANKSSTSQERKENPQRTKHLETLGLDPNKNYSATEITRWFKNLATKYHPDKHQNESEEEIRKLNDKLRGLIVAYNWLKQNPEE